MQARCSAQRNDGQPCRAFALRGSAFCINHDPARRQELADNRRRGGLAKSNQRRAARQWETLGAGISVDALPALLIGTGIAVLVGTLEPRQAAAFATCIRSAVQVQEAVVSAARLEELERLVRALGGPDAKR